MQILLCLALVLLLVSLVFLLISVYYARQLQLSLERLEHLIFRKG